MTERVFAKNWKDYELIDAGNGKKLERFGDFTVIRPEVNAYFRSVWDEKKWYSIADSEFIENKNGKGLWKHIKNNLPENGWTIEYKGLKFLLKPSIYKHLGIFPEQNYNWDFVRSLHLEQKKVLNLFSYTGAMSLHTASLKADTFHLDSSKTIVKWASKNAELNNFKAIHWVVEDATYFIEKAARRTDKYDLITMDPPAFGIGKGNKKWKIELLLPNLISNSIQALEEKGKIILNTYSPKVSKESIEEICKTHKKITQVKNSILCLKSKTGKTIETGLTSLIEL